MKPFNLEKAKAGAKVRTRNGLPVKIIAFDLKNDYPIVARVQYVDGDEDVELYNEKGKHYGLCGDSLDLVMVSEKHKKHKGWKNKRKLSVIFEFIKGSISSAIDTVISDVANHKEQGKPLPTTIVKVSDADSKIIEVVPSDARTITEELLKDSTFLREMQRQAEYGVQFNIQRYPDAHLITICRNGRVLTVREVMELLRK